MTPVGVWRSFDDKTNEPKSEVRITENAGVLQGTVQKVLRKGADPDAKCTKCRDALKDQPIVGLPIIQEARKADGLDYDPEDERQQAFLSEITKYNIRSIE